MGNQIIAVVYENKETGKFEGKPYNYYCNIPVAVGDVVIAPTYKGDSKALVVEIYVNPSTLPAYVLNVLKTISSFVENKEPIE
ncbi:hypothetical protein RFF05_06590 [Bengtsoniella intestinalis]|uniref:hypothetical protein n=1 Tax=Bengtsoniella intestinalis TaxID=3073143 RepID=UPI00391EF50C